jgi:ribosomal-protein-alanine N-acetyltransferase
MSSIPEFKTERLNLRGVTPEDFPAYHRHFVDYEVIAHLSAAVPWPFPAGGVADFMNSQVFPRLGVDRWLWGIFLQRDPVELIGGVDLWRPGEPENRGFWLGRKFWGRGIMTEAVAPTTNYAFNELGFQKLVFANAVGNTRSRRIKEKTGARLVEITPATFVDPRYSEREIWELTKEQWSARAE